MSFAIETRGCQMNVSDSAIVRSVLRSNDLVERDADTADLILLNTCAIRDTAEAKVWQRLRELKKAKKRVAVLGCMAERLKEELLGWAEVVAGPDAYRDLPRLLREGGINTTLSLTETYSDIMPRRCSDSKHKALVSIQRGCDNMCSYCVVPFTRGRERSRPAVSVVEECRRLYEDGARDITLVGQNVNSYADYSTPPLADSSEVRAYSDGFLPFVASDRKDSAPATRFAELLREVARTAPLARIRFVSPHPKDFPLELLRTIAELPNVAKHLHLPAQSGSNAVLKAMRRGYSVDAYEHLVERARQVIPGVTFSSDFIAGFCGETEEDHQLSLHLITKVHYEQAFLYAYSRRPKTHADYRLHDDVPFEIKKRRLHELQARYDDERTLLANKRVGKLAVVLVDGVPKYKPTPDREFLLGVNDSFRKFVFNQPAHFDLAQGDFCAVRVDKTNGSSLFATALYKCNVDGSPV